MRCNSFLGWSANLLGLAFPRCAFTPNARLKAHIPVRPALNEPAQRWPFVRAISGFVAAMQQLCHRT
jgi:hypothetical protein